LLDYIAGGRSNAIEFLAGESGRMISGR
jgi:hypothetical protein